MSPRQRAARGRASASRPVAPVEPVELVVDGLVVRLTRKRIKNLNLRVHRGGGFVEVSAPAYVRDRDIERFVREKRPWIDAKLAQVAASPAAVAAEAGPEEVAAWRAVVEACVPALVEAWEPIMGVKAGKLAYRNMTSRWGSCQPATGPHLHQRAFGALSARVLGVRGGARAVPPAGTRPRLPLQSAHGRLHARLARSAREAALGPW